MRYSTITHIGASTLVAGILAAAVAAFAAESVQYNETNYDFTIRAAGTEVRATSTATVNARTACDDQAKPALGCPLGYSLMCIPVGTPHWGCGKESNGKIIETFAVSDDILLDIDGLPDEYGGGEREEQKHALELREVDGKELETELDPDNEDGDINSEARGELELETEDDDREDEGNRDGEDDDIISVDADSVRAWDLQKKEEVLAEFQVDTEIHSERDIERFIQGIVLRDENIESMALAHKRIKVLYKGKGKILGVVPISYHKDVAVNLSADAENERIKVTFPWYRYFMKVDVTDRQLEAALRSALDEAGGEFTESAEPGVQVRLAGTAQAAAIVANVMKTKHDTAKNSIGNMR